MVLRLLTLNIRYGSGGQRHELPGYDMPAPPGNLEALARAIRSVSPDLVALQEVRNQRQAQKLAALTASSCIYLSHPLGYRLLFFEWGLAFLCRIPPLETASRPLLLERGTGVGRTALLCTLNVSGTPIRCINVHLDHLQRESQIEALLDWLADIAPPVCVMGDFNAPPDDPVLQPLRQRLEDSAGMVATDNTREARKLGTLVNQRLRVDHIWFDQDCFTVLDAGLVAEPHRLVSDHIGYFAEIELT